MTTDHIIAAEIINRRIGEIADEIRRIDDRHCENLDSLKWMLVDDNTVCIHIETSCEVNTACHCHPEYITHRHESRTQIPASEIVADEGFLPRQHFLGSDEFDPWNVDNVLSLKTLASQVSAEKRATEQKATDDARKQRKEQIERGRRNDEREFQRLKNKLGKEYRIL